MIKIVAKGVLKEGKQAEFLSLTKELIEKSRQEEGCIEYRLFQGIKNSSEFTFVEEWKDSEAIAIHEKSEHFTRILPQVAGLCVGNVEIGLYKEV